MTMTKEEEQYRLRHIPINEEALIQTIILQAILDYYSYDIEKYGQPNTIKKQIRYNQKLKSANFFKSAYFRNLCNLIDLDPNYIINNMKNIYRKIFMKKKLRYRDTLLKVTYKSKTPIVQQQNTGL